MVKLHGAGRVVDLDREARGVLIIAEETVEMAGIAEAESITDLIVSITRGHQRLTAA